MKKNKISKIPSKIAKDRAQTEANLLLAAEQIFAKYGFNGATTRNIAQAAGVNIALINRYFNSKYGLLLSLLERKHQEFDMDSLNYPPQKTLELEIRHYLLHKLHVFNNDQNLFKLVMNQFLVDETFLKLYREKLPFAHHAPDLEMRVKNFVNKDLKPTNFITNKEIKNIIEEIDHYFFGLVIANLIIDGKDLKKIEKQIKAFTKRYCHSL